MQQQHKRRQYRQTIYIYSDSCPIEYLWNGNHLLTNYDISLLLHWFKIATANDSTFVDFYRNQIASSTSLCPQSLLRGQRKAMLSACSILSGVSSIVCDAIRHVSVEYQVNTRFFNIPAGPSHCLFYITMDFFKSITDPLTMRLLSWSVCLFKVSTCSSRFKVDFI